MAVVTKTTGSPSFSDDEQALIIADLLALKRTQIGEFLASVGMAKSGTKESLRARIEEALDGGLLALSQVVQFLDNVIPWGKQHVYLFRGPQSSIANWRNEDWIRAVRKSGVGHLGNFYWTASGNGHVHILDSEVHVIVVGFRNRINFPTPNNEQTVRYVLSRIRSHCR